MPRRRRRKKNQEQKKKKNTNNQTLPKKISKNKKHTKILRPKCITSPSYFLLDKNLKDANISKQIPKVQAVK